MATRFYSNVEYSSQGGRGSNDPDLIYYNACIVNNSIVNGDPDGFNGVGNDNDTQVIFNDQRQTPILQNASEYNMSVIRFDLAGATKSLPLFVPRIVPGQDNIDLTIYNVYMALVVQIQPTVGPTTVQTFQTSEPVLWLPQYSTRNNTPQSANPYQVFNTDYYYCDSYSWWAGLVNTTVRNCQFNVLDSAVNAGIVLSPNLETFRLDPAANLGSPAPKLFYNPVTKLFSWSFDSNYWGQGFATNNTYVDPGTGTTYTYNLYLGMDTNLETLLTNFIINYSDVPFSNPLFNFPANVNAVIVTPQQIAIDTDPTTGLAYTNPGAGGHIRYVITQDYQSTSGNWSPIDSIVITSTKLPISQEIIAPAPGTFGTSDLGFNAATSGAAFQQVIADIQCGETGADDWRQYMKYEPKAEYRLLSFNKSQEPIQNVDFLVWWRNRYDNNLYPLRLYNGSAVSIKVLFRRKGY
jgi:hypothetical protein